MVLSWTRLTVFSGTLVAGHFIARKYLSSEEDDEENVSGILSPTLRKCLERSERIVASEPLHPFFVLLEFI